MKRVGVRYVEDTRPIEIKLNDALTADPNAVIEACPSCGVPRVRSDVSGVGEFSVHQYECKNCQRDRRLKHVEQPKVEEPIGITSPMGHRFITVQRGVLNSGGEGRFAIQPMNAAFIYFEDDKDGIPKRAEVVFPISAWNDKMSHYQQMAIVVSDEDAMKLSVYADAFSGVPQAEETLHLIRQLEQKIRDQETALLRSRDTVRQINDKKQKVEDDLEALKKQIRALS